MLDFLVYSLDQFMVKVFWQLYIKCMAIVNNWSFKLEMHLLDDSLRHS